MSRLVIRHVKRSVHRDAVARWHSHHKPALGELFALGAFLDDALVAVVVLGRPVAQAVDNGETWEVTRLAVGPEAPRFTASRLLGAAGRVMDASGVTLGISYTRVDEPGGCYKAANWMPVGFVVGGDHVTGNRRTRWLPGMYVASTEKIDRVRWERGPRAPSSTPAVEWADGMWRRVANAKAA